MAGKRALMRYFPLRNVQVDSAALHDTLRDAYGWDGIYADTEEHGVTNPIISVDTDYSVVTSPKTGRVTVKKEDVYYDELPLEAMHDTATDFLTYLHQSDVFQSEEGVGTNTIPYDARVRLEVIADEIRKADFPSIYKAAGDFAFAIANKCYPDRPLDEITQPNIEIKRDSFIDRPDKSKVVLDIPLPQRIWQQAWEEALSDG